MISPALSNTRYVRLPLTHNAPDSQRLPLTHNFPERGEAQGVPREGGRARRKQQAPLHIHAQLQRQAGAYEEDHRPLVRRVR